jgi:hypothetical protein
LPYIVFRRCTKVGQVTGATRSATRNGTIGLRAPKGRASSDLRPKVKGQSSPRSSARNRSDTKSSNFGVSQPDMTNPRLTIWRSSNSLQSGFGCVLMSPRPNQLHRPQPPRSTSEDFAGGALGKKRDSRPPICNKDSCPRANGTCCAVVTREKNFQSRKGRARAVAGRQATGISPTDRRTVASARQVDSALAQNPGP